MNMVLVVIGVAAALVIALLLAAASKPREMVIERRATMRAPAETIYPMIADFRRWAEWSPYDKLDPGMTRTYGGADSGVGATYAWAGTKAGSGRMEILDAAPPNALQIKLDFTKPMAAHNRTDFLLQPAADGTEVVWRMTGPAPFIARLMSVFIDLDRMIGKDFAAGLAAMKANAEGRAPA
jgi:hypothetical protein